MLPKTPHTVVSGLSVILIICPWNIFGKFNSFVSFVWPVKRTLNGLGTLSASVYSSSVVGGREGGSIETSYLNSHWGFSVSAKLALKCISKKCNGFCTCFYFQNPEVSSEMGITPRRMHNNVPVRWIQSFHLCNVQWRWSCSPPLVQSTVQFVRLLVKKKE